LDSLPNFIRDLSLILMAAGLVSILFRKIGQPVVLGYILSGFLLSSHIRFLPSVTDLPSIQTWGEIGVIFLLFALGLEFSFKKLLKVGAAASVTALIEIFVMMALGLISANIFGWSYINGLFLGGILAISSTTIIIRTLSEAGMKGRGFVDFVFGILIIEDLVAVLLLVILSTVAVTNAFNGKELLASTLKLFYFVIFCFISGIFLIPTLLKSVRKYGSDEMLLLVSLALCFFMVKLSTLAGFSPALGAFIMGSIIAETSEVKKIEHLIKPVRDLFGAIFFVSVGMLIDPVLVMEYSWPIAVLTVVTILGKFTAIVAGGIISKRSLRHSIQAGLSLAQIGEFSFIIAALGLNLKVTSAFLYPIAVGVSVITTFITPYLISNIDTIYSTIDKVIPHSKKLAFLSNQLPLQKKNKKSDDRFFIQTLSIIILNSVTIYAIFYFFKWLIPEQIHMMGFWLTLVISAPFFWAILMKKRPGNPYSSNKDKYAFLFLEICRLLIVWALFHEIAFPYLSPKLAISFALFASLALLMIFSRYLKSIYTIFEKHFMKNLSESETIERKTSHSDLAPWDAKIYNILIPFESEMAGKTLKELKLREAFGISVALIERGELTIAAPEGEEILFPNDKVSLIGHDENFNNFSHYLSVNKTDHHYREKELSRYALCRVHVTEKMSFVRKSILKSGLREKTSGMVAGLERHGEKILNPDNNLEILPGDILWIVGDIFKIKNLT
jgi:CPA2 family monovalent cation:H+ antiporter-2